MKVIGNMGAENIKDLRKNVEMSSYYNKNRFLEKQNNGQKQHVQRSYSE
jgi:hypothetical protein